MLSVWADVPFALTLRTFNANGGFNIVALDRNANFRFMMPEDGSLSWGPSSASTPAGIDTGLSRIGAASMALGNGVASDFSGTLKLTSLTFADGTTQSTAATSSGVSGLVIAPGKSLTVNSVLTLQGVDNKTLTLNNSLTLQGVDNKTLTLNNSLTFSGADGTVMTFPSISTSIAGLGVSNTWTAQQNYSQNIVFANNSGVFGSLVSGATAHLFGLDQGNNLNFGASNINEMAFLPGSGMQIRFLNAATTAYIMAMAESSRSICFGSNSFDSIWTFYDNTATTGDSVLSIRAGAAREARLRFGGNTGGQSYDVAVQRDVSGGILNVTDGSTTASNYRDLKIRNLFANGASSLGGGVGVIAIANASTPPTSNPAGGGILYVANGALMYRGASGTVTTLANA